MPPCASLVADAVVTGPRGPVSVRCYEPPAATHGASSPTLVWLHGGAFFAGRLDQPESDALARALAGRGVRVVNVDYALAPLLSTRWPCPARSASGVLRARFPGQVHDVSAVLSHVRATSTGPVLLGGASAGACLAAGTAVATAAAGDGGPRLDGAVLAYGFFHARLPPRPRALRTRLRGRRRFTHTRWPMMAMNLNYTGSRSRLGDASAFPGGHRLSGFPPTLLLDADRDGMRASSDLFAADLAAAGVHLEHQVLPESVHGFLGRPHEPAFAAGVDIIAAIIARWRAEMTGTVTATTSAASGGGDAEHPGPGR